MVERVIDLNEISLNGTRYPIRGRVSQSLISVLPSKVTIGEHSLADEQIASSWVINDARGGLGIEEMDERIHGDRYWWSTCDTRQKGHLFLNPLATAINNPQSDNVPTIPNGDMEAATGGFMHDSQFSQSTTQQKLGLASIRTINAGNTSSSIYLEGWTPGVQYTFTCHIYGFSGTERGRIQIADGTQTDSSAYQETQAWGEKTCQITVASTATYLKITLDCNKSSTDPVYFDEASMAMDDNSGAASLGTPTIFAQFDGELYLTYDDSIARLNAAGDEMLHMWQFPATITDMYSALHTTSGVEYLLVFLGDDDEYWYLQETVDTNFQISGFVENDTTANNLGVWWDGKAHKLSTTGQIATTVDPATASPTWADKGKLYLPDNSVKHLFVYRDADADPQVYAATKQGLWVHDYTNAKWIETELELPSHTTGGAGVIVWHDAAFISSGLHVDKYIAASTATILSVGLDEDDGLPSEFNGEILHFAKGHNAFHACVSADQVTGVGYSGIYDYNDRGWRCIWASATADTLSNAGIESTDVAYRYWWVDNGIVYYIALLRGIQNPLKVPTHAYATSGMHILSWFDGAWIGKKLALSIKMMCNNTLSSTEKITAYYRTDHSTTTIPVSNWAGWTKLTSATYADGVTADGEAEFEFGTSGVGVAFKSIQFGFDFERTNASPSTDKLKTPDLQYAKFKYLKQLDKKWGWNITVDCSQPNYKGNAPSQLKAALETAATPSTLMEFTFRDDDSGLQTHYVTLANATGMEQTGEDWAGFYNLKLVAP